MTDLQDQILDRLVGTPVGVNWPDGPLAIAAEVVGGSKPVQFGPLGLSHAAKAEIARRLHYPPLLCEAIQGGNRGLAAEDDRRAFAMNVFRTIPPSGPIPRLSWLEQTRIATRLAVRTHAYLCHQDDCAVLKALRDLAGATTVTWQMIDTALSARCPTGGGTIRSRGIGWLDAASSQKERLMHTAYRVLAGFREHKPTAAWCSIRESVRLAAWERGAGEAVACCIEIAQRCGMAV
jgi:hypothetical protein